MKESYQYAFRENAKGVSANSIYVAPGDALEKYIFDTHALPYVMKLSQKRALVDIGSGEGRYSRYFGKDFEQVISVEPDKQRYEKTREALADMQNVGCVHGTVKDIPHNADIDAIINIHVLQHVHDSAVEDILNFAGEKLSAGGLFILAMTKRTKLDHPWNIAWQDGSSHYSAIPKQIFEQVTAENLPGILPVRKQRIEIVSKQLEDRGFLIKKQIEYAPRFVDEKQSLKGKFFMYLYRNLSPGIFHRVTNFLGYPLQEDVLIVACKN